MHKNSVMRTRTKIHTYTLYTHSYINIFNQLNSTYKWRIKIKFYTIEPSDTVHIRIPGYLDITERSGVAYKE